MAGPTDPARLAGRRVVLRYRIGSRDGRPLLTDAVGELSVSEDGLLVQTRRGPVRVDPAAVVAAREVPPPRPRRPSWAAVARLEELCADAWPAVVERRLGAWRLRAAAGFSGRANSALVLGDPDRPLPAALAAVRSFAAEHGIPPRLQVPAGSPWEAAVAGQGWAEPADHPAGSEVAVLVGGLPGLSTMDPEPAVVLPAPEPAWWELVLGGLPGNPAGPTPAHRHVLTAAPAVGFGLCTVDRRAVGAVRACVVEDHLHVARLVVALEHRRASLGRALLAAAARWGAARGAHWCVSQVAARNGPALAFHERLGFTVHHRYRYLRPGSLASRSPGRG